MSYQQFQKDLDEKGIPCEKAVLKILQTYDINAKRTIGYDCDKDIVATFNGIKKLFEVKNCESAIVNVPVEVAIGDKPTGINRSKADYWVFFCKGAYHFIKSEVLKEITKEISEKKYLLFEQEVYIKSLPISKLKSNCHKIIKPL